MFPDLISPVSDFEHQLGACFNAMSQDDAIGQILVVERMSGMLHMRHIASADLAGHLTWTTTKWSSSTVATKRGHVEARVLSASARALLRVPSLTPGPFRGAFSLPHRNAGMLRCRFLRQADRPGAIYPMSVGAADTCPGSRPSRLQARETVLVVSSYGPTASIHATPRDLSLAGGESLVISQGVSHGPFLIKSMMPSLVAGHVPRNVRSFKYRVFDDQPLSSTLGFAIDPQPFDGKGGRCDRRCHRRQAQTFRVRGARSQPGDHGSCRRRQGACPTLCPSSLRRTARGHAGGHHREDFGRHAVHHHEAHPRLGAGPSCPFPRRSAWSWASSSSSWKRCRPLIASGASPTCWWMPVPATSPGSIPRPPRSSRPRRRSASRSRPVKFEGRVTIPHDRGGDTHVVELHRQNGESVELVDRHDEVYFDMLGEVLERLIDDGRWRQIDVSILDAKAARKRQAVPA